MKEPQGGRSPQGRRGGELKRKTVLLAIRELGSRPIRFPVHPRMIAILKIPMLQIDRTSTLDLCLQTSDDILVIDPKMKVMIEMTFLGANRSVKAIPDVSVVTTVFGLNLTVTALDADVLERNS